MTLNPDTLCVALSRLYNQELELTTIDLGDPSPWVWDYTVTDLPVLVFLRCPDLIDGKFSRCCLYLSF